MTLFLKSAGGALVAVLLGLCLDRQGKDMGLILTLAALAMILAAAMACLFPVVDFLRELEALGALSSDVLDILLKIVGIGLIGEVTGLICADAGRASLGKALQLASGGLILWMATPIFQLLLELVQDILGEL